MDETKLVMQLKEGNQYAFTLIYKKYAKQAYTLSFKYLHDKDVAEDAVQNLFLKLWLKRETLRPEVPVNRFLFTVLKNDLLTTIRDTQSDIFNLDDCMEKVDGIEYGQDSDSSYDRMNIAQQLMNKLSPQRKKIFLLKTAGVHSNQDIADQLSLSVNTIKFQYSRSLKQLREWTRELRFED